MPAIEIQHIVSCNSADKNNPAENLLKSDGTHKWKSASAGEKSVSVVMQLKKSSQIHSIDIGNEGSAFVEVLVGKATAAADQDFEVLLVASAFMTPLESRNGTNRTGVRMFGEDKLNKAVATNKWDRVKIVCTQPFCKTSQYGLSFIKLHSVPGDDGDKPTVRRLGAFTVKESGDEDIAVGSLFANRAKQETSSFTAGSSHTTATPSTSKDQGMTLSKAAGIQVKNQTKPVQREAKAGRSEVPPSKDESLTKKGSSSEAVSPAQTSTKPLKSNLSRAKTEPSLPSQTTTAFHKLMEKVVFVLSGFQNPLRGELREKALEMGATYKPDWVRECTHLICAFTNTPKYQQVDAKSGKIVKKEWILHCHSQKQLLPWAKYRLGTGGAKESDSDDEDYKNSKASQKRPAVRNSSSSDREESARDKMNSMKTPPKRQKIEFEDEEEDQSDSGGDTEDELRKARDSEKKQSSYQKPDQGADPYGESTDEDEINPGASSAKNEDSDSGVPDLPEFFSDKHFFFYGHFETAEQRLLTRYIAAYNGEVDDYMSKKVNYIITAQKWDENFDEALSENADLVFVKPRWILACHKQCKLVPYQPHVVVPE